MKLVEYWIRTQCIILLLLLHLYFSNTKFYFLYYFLSCFLHFHSSECFDDVLIQRNVKHCCLQALLIILGEEEFDVTKTAHFQSWLNTVRISKSALRASRNFDFENFDPNSTDAQIKALDQYLQSVISLFSYKFRFKTEELNSQTIVYEMFMLIHHKNTKYPWKQKMKISLTPSKNL